MHSATQTEIYRDIREIEDIWNLIKNGMETKSLIQFWILRQDLEEILQGRFLLTSTKTKSFFCLFQKVTVFFTSWAVQCTSCQCFILNIEIIIDHKRHKNSIRKAINSAISHWKKYLAIPIGSRDHFLLLLSCMSFWKEF